jgi:cytoskeletal protein CcmA (bactofilin family)
MVFRRDSKSESFQRQMSALRQHIGADQGEEERPAGRTYPSDRAPAISEDTTSHGFGGPAGAAGRSGNEAPFAPEMPSVPDVDERTTVVAHDTIWKGELQSNGTVHVHGRLEGAIRASQDIYIAEKADVDATIAATNVVVAGLARGTIRCNERFEVLPTGRVSGDIVAPTLVVHEGAVVSGQLRMTAQEPPEVKPTPVVQRRAARGTA